MAPRRPPPQLIDDVTAEILLRLPPDEPEHLFRAALVCKRWLRIICDPGFLRRYRASHGAPPLLGLLHRLQVIEGLPPARFASTTSVPDFPHPGSDGRRSRPLDCRHGRVLVYTAEDDDVDYLVWNPFTGHRRAVEAQDINWLIESAVLLCAAHGCDHLDCHGGGPFLVVFAATPELLNTVFASVYSSEADEWSVPVCLDSGCESFVRHMERERLGKLHHTPYLQPRRRAIVGDGVYFTLRQSNAIVKYDLGKNRLSLIDPPCRDVYEVALMAMEDTSPGFACLQGSSLYVWSGKVETEEPAEWVQYRVIELEKIIPVADHEKASIVVGSAEGVGVIFVSTDVGLFMINLNSGQPKKVDEPGVYFSVLPYMSFYTPDRGRLLSLARAS